MELKLQIPFQQLLEVVRNLTPAQKSKLRNELSKDESAQNEKASYIELLLKGPVYTDEQLMTIEENRASISKWRTKN